MASAVQKAKRTTVEKSSRPALKLALAAGRRAVSSTLPSAPDVLRDVLGRLRNGHNGSLGKSVRSLPIQCSVDIAVPLEVVYEEWMALDFLPEGAHRVQQIERDGEVLLGRLSGVGLSGDWEAEVRDERPGESFAWRSEEGSDCAGLVTFHRLAERLTRVELQLDVVPVSMEEAAELILRIADRRVETDLRRFKARLETISPDEYTSLDEPARNHNNKREK